MAIYRCFCRIRLVGMTFTCLNTAYVLVAHGSRDPRPQKALDALGEAVCSAIRSHKQQDVCVATATLECSPAQLHEQLYDIACAFKSKGVQMIFVLPLFLARGVHTAEDLPRELALAEDKLSTHGIHAGLTFKLCPFLGEEQQLITLLQTFVAEEARDIQQCLLLAHGTKRLGGNQPIEQLAEQIGAQPAYWFVEPKLGTRIATMTGQAQGSIGILPYFLFAGTTTDAIANLVAELSAQYPTLRFTLLPVLSEYPQFAELIAKRLLAMT